MAFIARSSSREALLRRVLPALLLAATGISAIRWYGERRHIYGPFSGFLLGLALMTASVVAIVLWAHRSLGLSEQELEAGERRYREIVETASDAIMLVDGGGRIVFANAHTADLLGIRPTALAGVPLERFLPELGADGERSLLELSPDRVLRVEAQGGSARYATARAARVQGATGGSVTAVFLRDVTEQVALTERVALAERMEALGQMAARISHDFANILLVVRGSAEVLEAELGATPQAALAREIGAAAERGSRLTRRLVEFASGEAARLERLDLREALQELESELAGALGPSVALELRLPDGPVPVLGDDIQLERVMLNLAANARDAMPEGGRLAVELGVDGATALLAVSDSGIGMDAETRAHLFEPFYTRRRDQGGTGLGLASVYRIVIRWGGSISVESAPGAGSTFRIALPIDR